MIALYAILLALALGAASGGSIGSLAQVRLRYELPVLVLFGVQAIARGRIAGTSASSFGLIVWMLSCAALIGILGSEWRRPGIWVVCFGLALNLLVVLLNGGMPVGLGVDTAVTAVAPMVARSMSFYQLAGPGTMWGALGDVVPLGRAGYQVLVSPGDALLAIGVAVFIAEGMLPRRQGQGGSASES